MRSVSIAYLMPLTYVGGLADIGSKLEKIGGDAEQLVSSEWEGAMKPFGSKLVHAAGKVLADTVHELETDVREKIDFFIKTFRDVVSLAQGLHAIIVRLTEKEGGMSMADVSQELDVLSSGIIAHIQQAFPPPDQAPSHKERMEMTNVALVRFENGLLDLTSRLGLPEGEISAFRNTLDQLRPLVKDLIVTMGKTIYLELLVLLLKPRTGDLIEQHPVLFYVIIFATLGQLEVVPEQLIIRPLLRLFGFGSLGPVKGRIQPMSYMHQFSTNS